MKIRETANQKNFIVDKTYYTENEIEDMLKCEAFTYFGDEIRIFTCFCSKVDIILDERGMYCAIVVLKDTNKRVHVVV